jgi:hypothetical protein
MVTGSLRKGGKGGVLLLSCSSHEQMGHASTSSCEHYVHMRPRKAGRGEEQDRAGTQQESSDRALTSQSRTLSTRVFISDQEDSDPWRPVVRLGLARK